MVLPCSRPAMKKLIYLMPLSRGRLFCELHLPARSSLAHLRLRSCHAGACGCRGAVAVRHHMLSHRRPHMRYLLLHLRQCCLFSACLLANALHSAYVNVTSHALRLSNTTLMTVSCSCRRAGADTMT